MRPHFNWEHPEGAADQQERAWYGHLLLWASTTGEWRICRLVHGVRKQDQWTIVVDSTMQTAGKDIDEAKQRAQAAAIVQLQLTGGKTT